MADSLSGLDDLDPEFVSRNPRVTEERHLAEVTRDIGSADADAMDLDEGFAGTRAGWFVDLGGDEVFWFFEEDGFHAKAEG